MTSYSDKDLFDFLNFNDTLVNSLLKYVYEQFLAEGGNSITDTMISINKTQNFFASDYTYHEPSKFMPVDPTMFYYHYENDTKKTDQYPDRINMYMGQTYRLEFGDFNNLITNPYYDIKLLQDSSLIKTKSPLPSLSNWVEYVPDTFLELCTSNINDFFLSNHGN